MNTTLTVQNNLLTKLNGIFFITIGLIVIVKTSKTFYQNIALCLTGEKVQGRVIKNVIKTKNSQNLYYPIVQYTDKKGKTYKLDKTTGRAKFLAYKKDAKVTVCYKPEQPTKTFIQSFPNLILNILALTLPFFIIIVGLYLLLNKNIKFFLNLN